MGYIYMLRNKVNNKMYIGQTQQEDIKRRWQAYEKIKKNSMGTVLFRALTKHTPENFEFKIICICFNEDCNKYEIEYIKKYNTTLPNGYNMQTGGKNPEVTFRKKIVLSNEVREAMKKRFQDGAHPNFGKQISDEQKKKLSEKLKGRKVNFDRTINRTINKNKSYTVEKYDENKNLIETFDSLSAAAKTINTGYTIIKKYSNRDILYRGFYWKCTEDSTSRTLNNLQLEQEKNKKKVNQYDLQMNFIASYDSISAASRAIGCSITTISRCASEDEKYKMYKTHKGFIWKHQWPSG
jgi:group I intron endonuclease